MGHNIYIVTRFKYSVELDPVIRDADPRWPVTSAVSGNVRPVATPNDQSLACGLGFDQRRVPRELPEPEAVVQPACRRVSRRALADDCCVSGPGGSRKVHAVQHHRPCQPSPPVARMCSDGLELDGLVRFIEPHDRRGGHCPVWCLHQNMQVATVSRGLPDVLIALGRVRRGSPGVHMRPDRGFRPGLVGGAEPEPRPAVPAAPHRRGPAR